MGKIKKIILSKPIQESGEKLGFLPGEIKDKIRTLQAACVFAEPQFEPKLIQTLIGGTSAKIGTLDPEASTLPAGPNLYFDLMRGLANNLRNCLAL